MVTRVAVQSQGPRNTHREVTYLQLGRPAICMRVAVCLHMQTNGLLYLICTYCFLDDGGTGTFCLYLSYRLAGPISCFLFVFFNVLVAVSQLF